jgi:hypothetical protein
MINRMPSPIEVFLSHASADEKFVTDLSEVLQQHHVPFWYSKVNIRGAQQWHDEIGEALNRCDWFLLILSPHSVKSMWVKRELVYALEQNRFADKIVPILYQDCDAANLSWVLSSFQYVNFQHSFTEGCSQLLRIWNLKYTTQTF